MTKPCPPGARALRILSMPLRLLCLLPHLLLNACLRMQSRRYRSLLSEEQAREAEMAAHDDTMRWLSAKLMAERPELSKGEAEAIAEARLERMRDGLGRH